MAARAPIDPIPPAGADPVLGLQMAEKRFLSFTIRDLLPPALRKARGIRPRRKLFDKTPNNRIAKPIVAGGHNAPTRKH
jgi:hypothetical protein